MKPSNPAVVNVPNYLNYFEFRKDENIKHLAKEILKGQFDFEGEEEKLDRILYKLLSRTEKYAFYLQTKKDKKINKVKFMSTTRDNNSSKLLQPDEDQSLEQMKWLT